MVAMLLVTPSVLSHSYHVFLALRTFKTYSLRDFQGYNRVSLAIISMLSIRSPELVNLVTKLVPFD